MPEKTKDNSSMLIAGGLIMNHKYRTSCFSQHDEKIKKIF